jgi:peptide/nickel transport system permease protein
VRTYIIRRLLQMIPVFLGIVILVFFIVHNAPGGPYATLMDPRMTAAMKAELNAKLGLDQPIYIQFYNWGAEALRGNLGYSTIYQQKVTDVIKTYIGPTFLLTFVALLFSLLVGIPTGIISATRQYSKTDHTLTIFSLIGISMPSFFFGLLLLQYFTITLGWTPFSGMRSVGVRYPNMFALWLDIARHMILPVIVLGLGSTASFMRYTRSAMLEVVRQDYIRNARAKGLKEQVVIYRHALRNALIPVITLLGFWVPGLLSGAVITESIFGWPGMGRVAIRAAMNRDYPLLLGINMLLSLLTLFGNLLADIFYGIADPRIKYD